MIFNSINRNLKYRKVSPGLEDHFSDTVDQILVLHATKIGENAGERIFGKQLKGYVFNVFQHALNIILDDGYLLCVVDEKYQGIPFGISVSIPEAFSFKNLVEANEPVLSIDNWLIIGNIKIELNRKIISSNIPSKLLNPDFLVAKNNVAPVINFIQSQSKRNGLYPLIPYVQSFLFSNEFSESSVDPICFYALNKMKLIAQYFTEENAEGCLKHMTNLIGLGAGLTPSGDDFLLGFFGLLLNIKVDVFTPSFINCIRKGLEVSCIGKTTLISEVYLTYGLKGQFTEVLSNFINSLFGADQLKLLKNTQELLNVGSSSGIDMMLGSLFALQLNRTKLNT